jgi:hypothetical protein
MHARAGPHTIPKAPQFSGVFINVQAPETHALSSPAPHATPLATGGWMHPPALHVGGLVHSLPSSGPQPVPSATSGVVQPPPLHTGRAVQGLPSSPPHTVPSATRGVMQAPTLHTGNAVQGLPSSPPHTVPSATGCWVHAPPAHTACVHGLPSSTMQGTPSVGVKPQTPPTHAGAVQALPSSGHEAATQKASTPSGTYASTGIAASTGITKRGTHPVPGRQYWSAGQRSSTATSKQAPATHVGSTQATVLEHMLSAVH